MVKLVKYTQKTKNWNNNAQTQAKSLSKVYAMSLFFPQIFPNDHYPIKMN
jgi:hypothetical protein